MKATLREMREMKVDLEKIKYAREIEAKNLMFCRECGETNPKNGFYPLMGGWSGPDCLSFFICNDCDTRLRKQQKRQDK